MIVQTRAQKRAMGVILGLKILPVTGRWKKLTLFSLSEKQLGGDMVTIY